MIGARSCQIQTSRSQIRSAGSRKGAKRDKHKSMMPDFFLTFSLLNFRLLGEVFWMMNSRRNTTRFRERKRKELLRRPLSSPQTELGNVWEARHLNMFSIPPFASSHPAPPASLGAFEVEPSDEFTSPPTPSLAATRFALASSRGGR